MRVFFIILLGLANLVYLNAQTLAFPEAVGLGKYATGGRAGIIYVVTNLNDSGAGSFRAAAEATGARIIVFALGGNIILTSKLVIDNDDITILGNTSPSDSGGITVSGATQVSASNVIIRYVRFRLGDGGYKDANGNVIGVDTTDEDALGIYGGNNQHDVIVDHCTISWGVDENMSVSGASGTSTNILTNVTVQNCINAHGLYDSHDAHGASAKAFLINNNVHNISFIHNYFAHAYDRPPASSGNNRTEMMNNVIYNFKYPPQFSRTDWFNVQGNMLKEGAIVPRAGQEFVDYVDGNFSGTARGFWQNNAWSISTSTYTEVDTRHVPYLESTPPISSGYTPTTAAQAVIDVLGDVGANYPYLDPLDVAVIADYTNNTGGLIDSQTEVGGLPTLAAGTPISDSDGDGLPNTWENTNGTSSTFPDSMDIESGEVYTNIELYSHSLKQSTGTINATGVTLTPSTVSVAIGSSTTISVAFTPSNTTDKTGTWSSSNASVATVGIDGVITPVAVGSTIISFVSNDGSFTDTSTVNVTAAVVNAGNKRNNKKHMKLGL